MSNIPVNPAVLSGKVKVKTEVIGDEHVPVYMPATKDGELVDSSNPLPISDEITLSAIQTLTDCLTNSLTEQKLTNLYLSKVVGEDLRLDSETEVYP